jgi:hypothetical protein
VIYIDSISLYDIIESELPSKYNEYKKQLGTNNPRFGSVVGIEADDESKTFFLENSMTHKISSGYIFPILGAFRSLIHYSEETKNVYWDFDPVEIWNEIGTSLAQNIFETSRNPQLAGKDKQLWLSSYRIVETQSLRKQLQNNR